MFTEGQLQSVLEDLFDRFQVNSAPDSGVNFYDRVKRRRQAFHNQLPTSFRGRLAEMTPFESDSPRQKWIELRARMTENHFIVRVKPVRQTATQRSDANMAEAVLNAGIGLVEERNGYTIQQALSDAQIIDGIGVLHWRKATDLYPDYPEAELVPDLPKDREEAKRFSKRRRNGMYVESPDSVRERRAQSCAKAGFPWLIECPDILSVMWDEDELGLGLVAHFAEMPIFRYARELDPEAMSAQEAEGGPDERIYRSRPLLSDFSNVRASDRVAVCTVWTRDRWYELWQPMLGGRIHRGEAWKLAVPGVEHNAGRPPWALVPATQILNRAPAESYLPALEGMFRLKGSIDRSISLMVGLQEQAAIGMYYLAKVGSGEPLLSETGDMITLSSDSADAQKVPDGYELKELRADVSSGFVQSVGFQRQEYLDAAPKTGRTDIGASSSPWTVRFALEMENIEPRHYVQQQLRAIQAMVRNIAYQMSQEEEPTYVYARITDGTVDEKKVLSLLPKQIGSLDVDADIDPTSQAERVALIEHGKSLVADGFIDDIEFLANYMKIPDPDKFYAQREAFKIFKAEVQPLLLKQELAKLLSQMVVLGPNGDFVGPGGEQMTPEQVLAVNGQQALPSPLAGGPPGTPAPPAGQIMGGVQGGGAMAPTIPDLPALTPPQGLPTPGIPG